MKRTLVFLALCSLFLSGIACAEDLKRLKEIDSNISKGNYETAIKEGLAYTAQFPDSAQGWNVVGWGYAKNNQLEEALQAFDNAIARDEKLANAYVGKGSVYRKQKKDDQARESYQQAIAINPKNATAYSSLLVIELQMGNTEKAVEYGEKAWKLNKKNASIAANLSFAYHAAGNVAKRDELYEAAKSLKYHNMAVLDKKFGK